MRFIGGAVHSASRTGIPPMPSVKSTLHGLHDVLVDGNLAYVADQSGVAIIDISDPTALAIASIYPTSGDTYGVTGAGGLFYAPDQDLGFICVDASLPEAPTLVGRAELDGRFQRGLVVGDHVVAAAMAGGLGRDPWLAVQSICGGLQ